jgi:hypothetical protein
MERVGVLLEKLKQQYLDGSGKEQMLITLGLLQAELTAHPDNSSSTQTKKNVSVILPGSGYFDLQAGSEISAEPDAEKIVEVLQVDEKEIEAELESLKKNAELKNELSLKSRPVFEKLPEPDDEIPTLASHQAYLPREVEEPSNKEAVVDLNQSQTMETSLNDVLREPKTELAEKLQDIPVRDLKKAIGINDRYLFINELFNGNEAMFERSLKTLNAFSILPEAEYWIERELKVKLGWSDKNALVNQFIQLVRRRFS